MEFSFLVYVSRSGSTMFARMLSAHCPDLLVLPEFNLIPLLLSHGDEVVRNMPPERLVDIVRDDIQAGNLMVDSKTLEAIVVEAAPGGIRNIAERVVSAYADSSGMEGFTHVLLQRGSFVFDLKNLMHVFPEARFIHIYRDPRGSINSMLKTYSPYLKNQLMDKGDAYRISYTILSYMKKIQYIKQANISSLFELSYEKLCSDPRSVLKMVTDYLRVGFVEEELGGRFNIGKREEAIHPLIDQPPRKDRIDAWKTELPSWKGIGSESILIPYLDSYGYDLWFLNDASHVRKRFVSALLFLDHLKCVFLYYFKRLIYRDTPRSSGLFKWSR